MAIKTQSLIPASCLTLAFCGFFSASLSADTHAATEDRLAIAEMLAQYSYRWDSKDSSGFADLFTFDAVMERWREGTLVENPPVRKTLTRGSLGRSPNPPPLFGTGVSRAHQPNSRNRKYGAHHASNWRSSSSFYRQFRHLSK